MIAITQWWRYNRLVNNINKGNNKLIDSDITIFEDDSIYTNREIIFSESNDKYFLDDSSHFNLSFNTILKLKFNESKIASFGNKKQRISEVLAFDNCINLKILDLSNIDFHNKLGPTKNAILLIDKCYNLTEINNITSTQLPLSIIFNGCILSRIHFAKISQKVNGLTLYHQPNFSDLTQIINGDIFMLKLHECCINKFTHHRALNVDNCIFDCDNIISFRDIQNFKINDTLQLNNVSTSHNMINLLLNTCETLIINDLLPRYQVSNLKMSVSLTKCIINEYSRMRNRHEYIMDCVIDLLENDCEKAAEL